MRTHESLSPVRRRGPSLALVACLVALAVVLVGCGDASSSEGPNPSLVTLDFSPLPTLAPPSLSASGTPHASSLPASWPVGWDVGFCTALADFTVAHELVIDIERAIADDNRSDAQGLANELAQTAPIATKEVNNMREWEPATELKTDLTNLLTLDAEAATDYQSYFNDDVKTALRQARQVRNQVSKAVAPANQQLQQLAALGVSCPGAELKLETF